MEMVQKRTFIFFTNLQNLHNQHKTTYLRRMIIFEEKIVGE
jgi:hypothetical protein